MEIKSPPRNRDGESEEKKRTSERTTSHHSSFFRLSQGLHFAR
jgi:hypothetical protein